MDLRKKGMAIAKAYQPNEKIAGILIAGSVSRGWDDAFSDIEMYVLWKEPPSDEDRLAPISAVNGQIMDFYPFEDNEWSETYVVDGIKLELSHFLVRYIDQVETEVLEQFDTDKEKQCLLAGIQDGLLLYGEKDVQVLKERAGHYPDALGMQMVKENLAFSPRWNSRYVLAEREDLFILYDLINDTVEKLLAILHGLNRKYVAHPRWKWLKQTVQEMKYVPHQFVARLDKLYKAPTANAINDLEKMILETFALISSVYPDLNISTWKDKWMKTRPTLAERDG